MTSRLDSSSQIVLFLTDVDGVWTDGSFIWGADGEVAKLFSARDGVAVSLLSAHGVSVGVISGKSSPALHHRMRALGAEPVCMGVDDKLAALCEIADSLGLSGAEICFVGDDIQDLCVYDSVGLFMCPRDAHELVRRRADIVLTACGGAGAVREAAERLLESRGLSLQEMYRPLLDTESQLPPIVQ